MKKRDATDPNRFKTVAVTADGDPVIEAEAVTREDPRDDIVAVVHDQAAADIVVAAACSDDASQELLAAMRAVEGVEGDRDDDAVREAFDATTARAAEAVEDDDDVTSLAAMAEGLSIVTDDEVLSYTCGYRAGGQDPGYLLDLAELGRHLGSFFSTTEETAFNRMPAGEWWTRWGLGYSDAVAGGDPRVTLPPKPAEMDW